jgi:hypothetical protein
MAARVDRQLSNIQLSSAQVHPSRLVAGCAKTRRVLMPSSALCVEANVAVEGACRFYRLSQVKEQAIKKARDVQQQKVKKVRDVKKKERGVPKKSLLRIQGFQERADPAVRKLRRNARIHPSSCAKKYAYLRRVPWVNALCVKAVVAEGRACLRLLQQQHTNHEPLKTTSRGLLIRLL